LIGGGAGLYYYTHLEETPITGRKRFMQVSGEQEKWMAKVSLEEIMQQYGGAILPAYHPMTRYVNKVAQRIIDAIDPALVQSGTKWRIFVVDAPVANAFVLPGGEIFVFTGILPVAHNEDGLAAVIGHEVGFPRYDYFKHSRLPTRLRDMWRRRCPSTSSRPSPWPSSR
jgi:predicted Zn-dependent protease